MTGGFKRYMAAAAGASILLTALTGCGAGRTADHTVHAAQKAAAAEEAVAAAEAVAALLPPGREPAGKDETVYVIADAGGKVQDTIVSAWLRNPEGKAVLEDFADLTDIENIKGEETFAADGTGRLTWQAGGKDIFYRGRTDRELPVTTDIIYRLDGEEKTPEELGGASGHLKITFSYTNHLKTTRTVNGRTAELYQPFLVLSGLMLDNDKAANVTVSNGRIINSGDRTTAVGYALPGLAESLSGGQTDPWTALIPDTVVIEADVADFSLLTTVTVVDNTFLQKMDMDNVRTLDDLKDAAEKLTDASGQLSEGSTRLSGGIAELANRAPALRDGAAELADGLRVLDEGAGQMNGGLRQISSGVTDLPSGAAALHRGARQLGSALKNDQGSSLYDGIGVLESGAQSISAGLQSGSPDQPGIREAAAGIQTGAGEIAAGADQISAGAVQLKTELDDMTASAAAGLAVLQQTSPAIYARLAPVAARYLDKAQAAKTALDEITSGAERISAGAQSRDPLHPGIYEAAAGIERGSAALAQGADSMAAGAADLKNGVDRMADPEHLGAVVSGLEEMTGRAQELVSGVDQLSDGGTRLAEGAKALRGGTTQLHAGSADLVDGVQEILTGANALKDGMAAFDQDGIRQLSRAVDEDAGDLLERLRALKELSGTYRTFSGEPDAPAGQVQFILRTAAID